MAGKVVLVDMDEVIAWTHSGFLKKLQELYPDIKPVPYHQTTEFYIENHYPGHLKEKVESIWRQKGLFRNLPIMPGALEALTEIKSKNEVFICSSPVTSPYCHEEKFEWIKENLGNYWLRKLILTKDKTIIYGDYLIDDKPEINGYMTQEGRKPFWEHVIYDHTWNKHIKNKKRITWQNWKKVLPELA